MTLQDFITKYNGKGIDYDNSFGNQCVDLMNQYLVDVCGITSPIQTFPGGTAFEIYTNANDSRFTKIANSPTGVPLAGDIIFWNTTIGSAGHVAVFISGDANTFTSFDQNWPTGSLCHEQAHDYNGVAGWLHFNQNDTQAIIDELRTARDTNYNLYKDELTKNNDLNQQLTDALQKSQDLRTLNDGLTKTDANLGVQLLASQGRMKISEDIVGNVAKQVNVPLSTPISPINGIAIQKQIADLQAPHTELAKQTVPVMDQLWENLRTSKIGSFWDWLALGLNLFKAKLGL